MLKRRNRKGQSLIEVAVGALFFMPIMLLAVDLGAIILSNSVNDHIAKDAARAAANQRDASTATQAAQKVVDGVKTSYYIFSFHLENVDYNSSEQVAVKTSVKVALPASFPGMSTTQFIAQAAEPVVGNPAEL